MASSYSLSAELPATRKSLRRSQRRSAIAEEEGSVPPVPVLPQRPAFVPQYTAERLSVPANGAWSQPQPPVPSATEKNDYAPVEKNDAAPTERDDPTVRKDLTIRRGGRGGEAATLKSEFDTSDSTYDERGYTILAGKEKWGLASSALTENDENDLGRPRTRRLAYLEGIRGVLGMQVLVWTFFRIFAPAIVADRDIDGIYPARFLSTAPAWQSILRKALSPLLFDGELQAAMFVILSGRASLQTFIERRVPTGLSGAAFKRPFRFIPPVAVTLALVTMVVAVNGFRYASDLSAALDNQLASPPAQWDSFLEYLNSVFFFFSTPDYYKTARATQFIPPAGTLWIIPVLFQQTYVLIILAFALPFTILRYKNLGMILLILTTAWVGRWSWYTLTGLLLAEWSTVYLQLVPAKGIPVNRQGSRFVPTWLPGLLFVLLGTFFKYLWIAALPADANNEVHAHVDGNTGKLNYSTNPSVTAYPRYDNWLLATGLLYLIEISPVAKRVLANKVFVHMGRWAFSIALISGTLMLSLGSLVWHHLTVSLGWKNEAGILGVLFLILMPASCLLAEAYSRLIDDSTLWFCNWLFRWIRV